MADKNYQLQIEVLAKDMASKVLGVFGKKLKDLALIAGGVGAIVGAGKMLKDFGEMAAEEAVGIQKLQKSVENTGANWEEAAEGIETYLAAQTKRIALDDGEGRAVLQSLTEITGDYKKSMDLLPLAADLAAAKGMDLATASQLVGRVAAGNTGILARYGIVLKKGASATEALAAMTQKFGGQAEEFAKSYQGQMQIFNIQFNNLKETIGGAVLPIMTKVATALADLATKAIPVVERAIAKLMPVFNAVGVAGQAVIDVLRGTGGDIPWEDMLPPWLAGVAYAVSDAFAGITAGIQSFVATTQMGGSPLDALNNGISTFLETIGASESVLTFVLDTFYALSESIASFQATIGMGGSAWDALNNGITTFLENMGVGDDVLTLVMDVFYEVGEAVSGLLPVFKSFGATVTAAFKQVAPVVQNVMGTLFTERVKTVGVIFNTVFPQIIKIVQTVMTAMQAAIKQAVPVVIALFETLGPKVTAAFEIIRRIVADVVPFVSKLIQEMVAFALKTFGTLISWVTANMPLISQTITTVLNAIQTVWNAVWPVLQVVVLTVWEVIKTAISTALNVILGIIKMVMQAINGDWAGAWESFKGVVTTVLSGVFTIIQTILGNIATLIGGKVGEFVQLASDLIGGLVQGIEDNASAVMDALLKIIKDGVSAVKKFFGIQSPSTVMISIGQDLMGGLVIGIEASGPDVEESLYKVMADLIDVMTNVVRAIKEMASGDPNVSMTGWKQAIIDVVTTVSDAMVEIYAKANEALKVAGGMRDRVTKVLDIAQAAVRAVVAIAETYIEDIQGASYKWSWIVTEMIIIVQNLALIAVRLDMSGYAAAELFAESAGKIVSLVEPAVSAITALVGAVLEDLDKAAYKWSWVVTAVMVIVQNLSLIAADLDMTGYAAAVELSEAASKILPLVKNAVDAIAAIATYEPAAGLSGMLDIDNPQNIFSQLDQILSGLRWYAGQWGETAEEIVAKFDDLAAFVGPVVEGLGLIKPVVDAIAAMSTYAPAADLARMLDIDNPDNIFSQLDQILSGLRWYAGQWGESAEEVAAKFAALKAFVGPVVEGLGLIKPVIDAIAAIASYEAVKGLATKIINFANDLDMVLRRLKALSELWVKVKEDGTLDDAVLAAIALFSTNVQSAVSFIKPAIEAVETLAKYKAAEKLAEKMTKFTNDVIIAVGKIREMALNPALGADTLALATTFATDLGKLTSTMSSAITGLGQVLSYKGYSASKAMGALQTDLDKMLVALGQMVNNLAGQLGVEKANTFQQACYDIKTAIEAGLGHLTDLGGGEVGASAAEALAKFAQAAKDSMVDAVGDVKEGLRQIIAAFTDSNTLLYQAAYAAGSNIGRGIMAGLRAQITTGNGNTYNSTTQNSNTYNITQTGAAQTPNSLRTTVTALQMAGTA